MPSCGATVRWPDAKIHHIEMYSEDGATILSNGALVHKHCHPKSATDVAAFAKHWETAFGKGSAEPIETYSSSLSQGKPVKSKSRSSSREKAILSLMKHASLSRGEAEATLIQAETKAE
jgi:hypothetical protein